MDNGYGGTALVIVDMVKDFTSPDGLVYYPQNRECLGGRCPFFPAEGG